MLDLQLDASIPTAEVLSTPSPFANIHQTGPKTTPTVCCNADLVHTKFSEPGQIFASATPMHQVHDPSHLLAGGIDLRVPAPGGAQQADPPVMAAVARALAGARPQLRHHLVEAQAWRGVINQSRNLCLMHDLANRYCAAQDEMARCCRCAAEGWIITEKRPQIFPHHHAVTFPN